MLRVQLQHIHLLRPFFVVGLIPLVLFLILLNSAALHAQSDDGTYTVQPGDTLGAIATQLNVSLEELAAVNGIIDVNQIDVGQVLIIPGATDNLPFAISYPGETLADLALRWQVPVTQLAVLNEISPTVRLFPGQPVRLPEAKAEPGLRFGVVTQIDPPRSVVQGETGWLTIASRRPVSLSVSMAGAPSIDLDMWENTSAQMVYAAHLPVSALTTAGPTELAIRYTIEGEEPGERRTVTRTQSLSVLAGGYFNQAINLPPDQSDLLNPETNDPELAELEQIWSDTQTPIQWDQPFQRPIGPEYPNTSPFGTRRSYNGGVYSNFHTGEDFGAPVGIGVTAPGDGIVVLAEPLTVRGNAVIIDHGQGVFSGYWHLSEIFVVLGEAVTVGQSLGTVGTTGRSTGPHLHWELRINGVAVNPMQFLDTPLFPPRNFPPDDSTPGE